MKFGRDITKTLQNIPTKFKISTHNNSRIMKENIKKNDANRLLYYKIIKISKIKTNKRLKFC